MTRILIVEDNPLNMELATDILEACGHEILQADNAEKGIARAREERPDLILMDIRLPGMDGLEATAILKANPETRDIPVIALTAQAMPNDREKAEEAGCDGYIIKPFDTKLLPAAISRALESRNKSI